MLGDECVNYCFNKKKIKMFLETRIINMIYVGRILCSSDRVKFYNYERYSYYRN